MSNYTYAYVNLLTLHTIGQHVSAVRRGLPNAGTLSEAMSNKVVDRQWRLNVPALVNMFCGNDAYQRCFANVWTSPQVLAEVGEFHTTRKGVDWHMHQHPGDSSAMSKEIIKTLLSDVEPYGPKPEDGPLAIVSGNPLLVPLVNQLIELGYEVDVIFWSDIGSDLRHAATRFVCLDEHFNRITLHEPAESASPARTV